MVQLDWVCCGYIGSSFHQKVLIKTQELNPKYVHTQKFLTGLLQICVKSSVLSTRQRIGSLFDFFEIFIPNSFVQESSEYVTQLAVVPNGKESKLWSRLHSRCVHLLVCTYTSVLVPVFQFFSTFRVWLVQIRVRLAHSKENIISILQLIIFVLGR